MKAAIYDGEGERDPVCRVLPGTALNPPAAGFADEHRPGGVGA